MKKASISLADRWESQGPCSRQKRGRAQLLGFHCSSRATESAQQASSVEQMATHGGFKEQDEWVDRPQLTLRQQCLMRNYRTRAFYPKQRRPGSQEHGSSFMRTSSAKPQESVQGYSVWLSISANVDLCCNASGNEEGVSGWEIRGQLNQMPRDLQALGCSIPAVQYWGVVVSLGTCQKTSASDSCLDGDRCHNGISFKGERTDVL